MANLTVEERLTALEAEVARLKQDRSPTTADEQPWWEKIWGTFKNDASYEEAMRLGREYRESLRPKDYGETDV